MLTDVLRTLHTTSSELYNICIVSKRSLLTRSQFDERKGATWHCIVGRNFGSFVTHGRSSIRLVFLYTSKPCLHRRQRRSTSSTFTWATARYSFLRRSSTSDRLRSLPWNLSIPNGLCKGESETTRPVGLTAGEAEMEDDCCSAWDRKSGLFATPSF